MTVLPPVTDRMISFESAQILEREKMEFSIEVRLEPQSQNIAH